MKTKIKQECILLIVLFIFNLILWLCFDNQQINQMVMIFLDIWIIFCYLAMIICVNKACAGMNYISAWIIITLPFYFGQYLFYYYNRDIGYLDNVRSIFNGIFSESTIFKTIFFSLECLLVLCFAAIESYDASFKKTIIIREDLDETINKSNISKDLVCMRIVATIFFAISLAPTIYYWVYAGRIGRMYGYAEMKDITSSSIKSSVVFLSAFISGWFMPSAYMLLISARKKVVRIIVTISLILVVYLIFRAGSRYKAIEIMVAYILIDQYWLNRNKSVNYIKYVIIICAVFLASTMVRLNRGGASFSGFNSLLLLSSILGDTGSTNMINCAALEFIPERLGFGYGISFVNGILALFPSAIRTILFPNLQTDITGTALTTLSGVTWSSFGSSIIAEGYYNFGVFSLGLMALYGVLLGKIVNIHKNKIGLLSPNKFVFYVIFCSEFVFAIRSEFSSCFRSLILYALFPIALITLLKAFFNERK